MEQPPSYYAFAAGPLVGPVPAIVTCPACRTNVRTQVRHESTTKTHIIALIVCFICCCFAWVPYCVESCKNANHYCPRCQAFIGSYKS